MFDSHDQLFRSDESLEPPPRVCVPRNHWMSPIPRNVFASLREEFHHLGTLPGHLHSHMSLTDARVTACVAVIIISLDGAPRIRDGKELHIAVHGLRRSTLHNYMDRATHVRGDELSRSSQESHDLWLG